MFDLVAGSVCDMADRDIVDAGLKGLDGVNTLCQRLLHTVTAAVLLAI